MTMTDPIADMLTRIRNANMAMHDDVRMPSSKQKERSPPSSSEGYIEGFDVTQDDRPARPAPCTITMKYSPERARDDLRPAPGVQARPAGLHQGRPRSPGSSVASASPSSRPARAS